MTFDRPSTTDGLSRAAVVVMVAATDESYNTARLLIGALGAVQVMVVRSGKPVPPRASIVILLDDHATVDGVGEQHIWRLADAPHAIGSRHVLTATPRVGRIENVTLYTDLVHHLVVTNNTAASPLENASELTWYYAEKRLRKSASLTDAERAELDASRTLLEREFTGDRLIRQLTGNAIPLDAAATVPTDEDFNARHPESIFLLASSTAAITESDRRTLIARLEHWLPRLDRARELAWAAAASHLIGDRALFDAATARLLGDDLFDPATGCVRSKPNSDGYCYSPLLAAVLLIARRITEPHWRPEPERSQRIAVAHRVFEPSTDDPLRACLNRKRRLISRSLLIAWRQLHTVPNTNGRQYELHDDTYSREAGDIEAIWLTIFRTIILQAGHPFMQLIPWPRESYFALSLRYDIDRPTTPRQVERIIDLQRTHLNAMCGSWYAFSDGEYLHPIESMLKQCGQEIGRHAVRAEESIDGLGVTFHSAPTSSYWRGSDTITTLESGDARYAEMLAAQLDTPRPGWIASPNSGRPTDIPLTPLHFPLEGSTSDDSLAYFDRLLPAFRRLRKRGGHLIVASHPDLNQELLAELLEREDWDGAWCAPVGEVVDRSTHVLGYDRIRLLRSADAETLALVADDDIDELQVHIDDGEAVVKEAASLAAGRPTLISPSQ